MRGFAGVYAGARPVEPSALDGLRSRFERSTVLSLGPLAVVGTEVGVHGAVVVALDGELVGHAALRSALERRGLALPEAGPAQTIAAGWTVFGAAILDRLEGAFSFLLWDGGTHELLLCRDRPGHRPLYYSKVEDQVLVSSSLAWLQALRPLERDPTRLAGYLLQGYASPPDTLYRNVKALEPAHLMRYQQELGGRRERYWAPSFVPHPSPPSYLASQDALADRLLGLLEEGLPASGATIALTDINPEGALLAALANKGLGRRFELVSLELGDEDAKRATALTAQLGIERRAVRPETLDLAQLKALVRGLGGPFASASPILHGLLAEGCSGAPLVAEGADAVFAGHPRHLEGHLSGLAPELLGRVGRSISQRVVEHTLAPLRSRAERASRFFGAVERPLERRVLGWSAVFPEDRLASLFRPELRRHAYDAASFSDRVFSDTIGHSNLSRTLDHNYRTYLPEVLLPGLQRAFINQATIPRTPYLDTALHRWVGELPGNYLVQGPLTKRLLRDTAAKWAGSELAMGPGRDDDRWLSELLNGPWNSLWRDAVLPSTARIYDYLSVLEVRSLISREERWNPARWRQILALLTLELWLS